MSIDFKDAYFHIPIQNQLRKYRRFHVKGKTVQSTGQNGLKHYHLACPQLPWSSL